MLADIDNLIDKKDIVLKFKKLFKIPRSILGNGFRDSLDLIGEDLNLKKVELKSKTKVLDWIIPDEWNIDDGYLITPDNKKICDFKENNLHILNYSSPINKLLDLKTLKKKYLLYQIILAQFLMLQVIIKEIGAFHLITIHIRS